MTVTRREMLGAISAAALALAGCASTGVSTAPSARAYRELSRAGRAGGRGRILVLMPATPQTRDVWTGLCDELGGQYELTAVEVQSREDDAIVAEAIERLNPSALVLMNNPTLAAYAEYQRKRPGARFPPSVVVMSSFLEAQRRGIAQATGIVYEVPLITVVTNLRKVIATPIETVGVVRRSRHAEFVRTQAKLAAREGIALVEREVSARPNASEVKRALRQLREEVDVLWVLNDDRLLTPALIANAWLVGVSERPWIPTLVGAASLVSPAQGFGTFAVLPDHAALGAQAAAMLFDLAEAGWAIEPDTAPQLPVSTTSILDLFQVNERFALREGALAQVDRVLK